MKTLCTLTLERRKKGGSGGARGLSGWATPQQAMTYIAGLGKGLREPCPPYRQAYVFGAELNVPDADSWNCAPQIVDPADSFDLSLIAPNHEVVTALLVLYNIPAGAAHEIELRWYRDRDGKLLFAFPQTIPDAASQGYISWVWYYIYSYIGYVPWEIYEDGAYHLDINFDGSLLERIGFTVSGVLSTPQINDFQIADFNKAQEV